MATKLTDLAINELSLVFANYKGKEWAPRNEEARVLAVKGDEKTSVIDKVRGALKGYFASNNDLPTAPAPFPVSEAEDNIDNDGDGPEDYNQIVCALCSLYCDLQGAFQISEDSARSAAIVAMIDSFLKGLDALRAGDDDDDDDAEKAGARHSAQDIEQLRAIADAMTGLGTHIEAIGGALTALGVTGAHGPVAARQGEEEESGPDSSDVDDDTDGSRSAKAEKKDEGKYGDVAYADEKNKKYPIDTEEHARAAWSYINQEKNASEYSADELKEIRAKIIAACKKFGIEISDDSKDSKKAEEVEMNQEQIAAMIAEASQAAAAKAAEAVKAELQPQIDAAKAKADEQAELAEQFRAEAQKNTAVIAALGGSAAKGSALSAAVTVQKSRLQERMVQEMRNNPEPTVI